MNADGERPHRTGRPLSRRAVLRQAAGAVLALPLARILGCAPGGGLPDALAGDAVAGDAPDPGRAGEGWATGGTAAMTARSRYPDPFADLPAASCLLTCRTTLGPCHAASPERADLSDGLDGLPVRLAFRVVDADCRPVEGALVEVWHTNAAGVYSADVHPMCSTDESDRAAGFFRGYRRTATDGRADFDTCFPGWYPGRAVHVHVRVMKGAYDGADDAPAWVTTQVLFDDDLVREICAHEPLYRERGLPDTFLADDGVLAGEREVAPWLFTTARMPDGAMLASKTLVLRRSLADLPC